MKSEGAPCNSGPTVFYPSPSRRRSLCRTDYYGGENAQKSDAFRDATSNATVRTEEDGGGREELAPSVRQSCSVLHFISFWEETQSHFWGVVSQEARILWFHIQVPCLMAFVLQEKINREEEIHPETKVLSRPTATRNLHKLFALPRGSHFHPLKYASKKCCRRRSDAWRT